MADATARIARVERLLEAARALAASDGEAGQALRQRLRQTSGLSPENIELGLRRCLELEPEPEHLQALVASTPTAPRAHVLLSGNVFVAALRAIAIGVAASERVFVRASRRDPALAEALQQLRPELFTLHAELSPSPGDHVWGYGSDETLAQVRSTLAGGVWFHHHGSGFGAVVINPSLPYDAREVALDVALFDQRGCLSPRVVCVQGDLEQARTVAHAIAGELRRVEQELPLGSVGPEILAEMRRQRDAAAYAFELFEAGRGWVSLSTELVVPPANRNLHVCPVVDAARSLEPFEPHLTCLGANFALGRMFPGARQVALGQMQRPLLDGPVDLRRGTIGQRL